MSQETGTGPREVGVVGVSHRTAPIQVRERFHGGVDGIREAIGESAEASLRGSVILSTCNRVELYLSSHDPSGALTAAEEMLARRSGLDLRDARSHLYRHTGRGAVEHLFRVVSGLDSIVPGEAEIQGQVGDAYKYARRATSDPVDPVLHRLFQDALSAGGRVRAETALGEGAASVPSAAVELARKVFGSLEDRRAMVLGAGAMGRLTMECLVAEGVRHAAVASRTAERARELAQEFGGEPVEIGEIPRRLGGMDILVSCTSAGAPILREEDLRERGREGNRPLVILDIAVPRDVEPGVDRLPEVFLYNVDDLQRVVEGAEESRLSEVPRAEAILREGVESFLAWQRSRLAVPMIRELRGRARAHRDRVVTELLDELEGAGDGAELSEAERDRIRDAFRLLVNRLLHEPTVALREAATRPDGERHLEAMRRLFDLDVEPGPAGEPDDPGSASGNLEMRDTEEPTDE